MMPVQTVELSPRRMTEKRKRTLDGINSSSSSSNSSPTRLCLEKPSTPTPEEKHSRCRSPSSPLISENIFEGYARDYFLESGIQKHREYKNFRIDSNGVITCYGSDSHGIFFIHGEMDEESNTVQFSKTYLSGVKTEYVGKIEIRMEPETIGANDDRIYFLIVGKSQADSLEGNNFYLELHFDR